MLMPMNQLFDQIHKIPQVPDVVRTLIVQFNDPKVDFNAIAKNIEKEQMISLKVLRLVNSAHFGLSKKVGTIQDAIVMLGMNQLRTLVIASGLVNSIPKIENFNLAHFWENSFRTATYAKGLAKELKIDADLAFTAGLISDLGNILIHMGAPKEANEIDQHVKAGSTRSSIETRRLGFTSEDVCAELCRRWHFSPELIDAVAHCGEPLKTANSSHQACVVHIARYLSYCQQSSLSMEEVLKTFPSEVAAKIGLSETFMTEKLPELLMLESGMESLAA
ncbi:MAG: HDOD domain-containing protein [Methylicorpusculum sp.]|nr:HDOD domain-containing protein [Methylicorpusculum sp.]